MPFPPQPDTSLITNLISGGSTSSNSGFGGGSTQEASLPNFRNAVATRNILHWLVPQGPIVQMYINPQNINYNYRKNISSTRTKGGYTMQYWGEELTVLHISGTTGTSGIEGINVLYDLYRNEQEQFDPFALYLQAQYNQANSSPSIFGGDNPLLPGASIASTLLGAAESVLPQSTQPAPTLASMAFTVEMYWSGEVYRGYFNDFIVTEDAMQLGLFNYTMTFTVTQKRGFRQNFLAWHRSPLTGPSNSDPNFGTAYSFGQLQQSNQFIPGTILSPTPSSQNNNPPDPFDIF